MSSALSALMFLELDNEDLAYVTGGGSSSSPLLMMAMLMTHLRGGPVSGERRKQMFEMMKIFMDKNGGKPAEGGK